MVGNETYKIEVESPLVRYGIKVSTKVSKRYLVETLNGLMESIREFNEYQKKLIESRKKASKLEQKTK